MWSRTSFHLRHFLDRIVHFFLFTGPMVISWKKSDPQGGNLQYLATGTHRLTSDTRVSVENADEKGSTLVISFANDQDVGDYVCEVSSNPPATLRHHVSLIGKQAWIE